MSHEFLRPTRMEVDLGRLRSNYRETKKLVDGATRMMLFYKISLPLTYPALITVSKLHFFAALSGSRLELLSHRVPSQELGHAL